MPPLAAPIRPGASDHGAPDRDRARPAAPPPPIPGYGLAIPTEADVVHAIRRHFGADETARIWDAACRGAGLRRHGRTLLPDDLAPLAAWLAGQEGVLRAVGQSLAIRLRTYRLLAATRAGAPR